MVKRNCGRMGRKGILAYPSRSREWYLEAFGLAPEEIFTAEELRHIDAVVLKDAHLQKGGVTK